MGLKARVLVGLILSVLLLLGISAVTAAAERSIVIGQTASPVALDVYHDPAVPSQTIVFNILEPLVILSHDGSRVVYRLATSIESADPLTWVVHLRQGVVWHDGRPFTAEDVVSTFDLMEREAAAFRHKYPPGIVKDVIAINDYTVQIVTERPYAVMIRRLVEFPMLPKHVIESIGIDAFSRAPVGTGPYRFVEWVKDDHVTLTANQTWWGGTPLYDTVVFRTIPDMTTRLADLLAGTIDLIEGVSPDIASVIEEREGLEVIAVPGLRCMSLDLNSNVEPLNDVRVRQAMAYAIDRSPLIDYILGGYASPSYAQATAVDFGFTLLGVNKFEYNPQKAKELLAEAGYPDGFEIDFQLGRRFLKDLELMQAIQDQLAKVGIKLNIVPMEWGSFYTQYYSTGKMTMALYGFANMIADADLPFFNLYHSQGTGWYYNNPQLDEVIDAQEAEVDPCIREQLLHSILREVANNVAEINLFRYQDLWGQKEGLEWFPRVDKRVLLYEL